VARAHYEFTAEVWEYESTGAWHFVSLPFDHADEIDDAFGRTARGFGSLRVEVTIGSSRWATSIFPDSKRKTYVLPVKKAIRKVEGLVAGSVATVELDVL